MKEKVYKSIHDVDLDIDNDKVVLAYDREGGFEESTFAYFHKLITQLKSFYPRPLVFADIGAYTGIYTIYAASRGCSVEAFEPNPDVYNRLRENVDYNLKDDQSNIRFHKCAISNEPKEALFYTNPNANLTSGGSLSTENHLNKTSVAYPVVADNYNLTLYQLPDIMKIDVEGHEMSVLLGMKWLSDPDIQKPFIIIEANYYDHYTEIVEYLVDEIGGYVLIGKMDGRNIILAPISLPFFND